MSIQLYSGKIFDPLNPIPDTFTLEDIIQGLLHVCRFAGQTKYYYPVLQHCTTGARWFRKRGMTVEAQYFLFHENEEGLGLGDLPTPIKYLKEMSAYRVVGKAIQLSAFKKVGLIGEPPKTVKELDVRMACAEAKVLCKNIPEWASSVDTSDIKIKIYKNLASYKREFLKEYKILFPKGIDINV